MKKVILHICCGVCAVYCIEYLRKENFYVEGFFFNPNIHPEEEYIRRKKTLEKLSNLTNLKIIEGLYIKEDWDRLCGAYKDEAEGGLRCNLCYKLRLKETAKLTFKLDFDYFTTTLTISPHKKSKNIFEIANSINKERFLPIDFKKNDGFKKTIQLSEKYNLYRQNYCGCIYSRKF